MGSPLQRGVHHKSIGMHWIPPALTHLTYFPSILSILETPPNTFFVRTSLQEVGWGEGKLGEKSKVSSLPPPPPSAAVLRSTSPIVG